MSLKANVDAPEGGENNIAGIFASPLGQSEYGCYIIFEPPYATLF